jgi:hypothetical protein
MRIKVLLLIVILLNVIILHGQRVYFCDNYTQTGEPIGTQSRVLCPPEGGYIYVLYQNGQEKLISGNYFLNIEKLTGESYVPFDVKSVTAETSKNWFVYDYKFLTSGNYKITVKNPSGKETASDYITLVPGESSVKSFADIYDDPTSTFYYTYSKVEATTTINSSNGEISGPYTSFSIDKSLGGRIHFKVTNDGKALGTDQFTVNVDKKNDAGQFDAFDSKNFPVTNKNVTWEKFYLDFYTSGEYNISVFSSAQVLINTVTITVIYKQ